MSRKLLRPMALAVLGVFILGACAQSSTAPDAVNLAAVNALVGVNPQATQTRADDLSLIGGGATVPESDLYDYQDDVWITSADGTRISANVFRPTAATPGQKFPAIIFVNSWSMDEYEYTTQAIKFAEKGYIVLSYSTRGFGKSEGLINTAGPKDMVDLGKALDWLETNTAVDVNNIGICGISYGAGISLLGLATHPRIKTAVPMSGWANLQSSLYGGDTPRLIWGAILVLSGYATGNMDPVILNHYTNILTNRNIQEVIDWAAPRSPATVLNQINARNAPVYISNNYGDNLFQPNPMIDFYRGLTGPKRLDLNQGIHATAEIGGLLGLSNFVWNNAHDWFDHWLKGANTGIMNRPAVTMELKFSNQREEFANWAAANPATTTFYMSPRGWFSNGGLKTSPNGKYANTKIYSGDSGASTGIPLLSPIVEGHIDLPVKKWIPGISRTHGVVYESSKLSAGKKLRGSVKAKVWITPSRSKAQVAAYLYAVDGWGVGTLITHGTVSLHDATPGQSTQVAVDLVTTAYDLKPGHRLAIAFDTFDLQYGVPTLAPYSIKFNHASNKQSTLEISGLN